jgi:hypothetical protein
MMEGRHFLRSISGERDFQDMGRAVRCGEMIITLERQTDGK